MFECYESVCMWASGLHKVQFWNPSKRNEHGCCPEYLNGWFMT